ncbi:hypothetical protein K493DRAFT_295381 [Basidiobolus meristosporus CBS 931.73]|uniref:Uncharacterized protein n=1 Tax=Basidiobolus meristosporus CBS 931.73 TaxID=1314790 RepID=A0A1Y1ZBV0_9FUNG|nr:hypothetical protein K493DRAFT_295381 [Basidiobolus meristosporus CBS 931.73]|eukprot:ORY07748.1 hypothetical protein K493DRAFT_295381 [Basidiobolus meristosporus CBS 931.73]
MAQPVNRLAEVSEEVQDIDNWILKDIFTDPRLGYLRKVLSGNAGVELGGRARVAAEVTKQRGLGAGFNGNFQGTGFANNEIGEIQARFGGKAKGGGSIASDYYGYGIDVGTIPVGKTMSDYDVRDYRPHRTQ